MTGAKDGLPMDILKGAALSSGMYDLKPVRLSKRSKYVAFTDEMESEAQRHTASRQAACAAHSQLWHLRDAGIPAPVTRLRRGGEGCRQAGRASSRRGLQSFRDVGDAGQPLWPARSRRAGANATHARIKKEASGGRGSVLRRRFTNRRANKLGAAAAAGIDGVFNFGRNRAPPTVDHAAGANRAGHHQ